MSHFDPRRRRGHAIVTIDLSVFKLQTNMNDFFWIDGVCDKYKVTGL